MIARFGENVYSAEVEAVLNAHPAVVSTMPLTLTGKVIKGKLVKTVQFAPTR